MAVESQYSNIGDLNPSWPTPTDPVSEGDDHLRGIKSALQGNVQGSGTETVVYNGSTNKPLGPVLRSKAQGIDVLDTVAAGVATAITLRGQAGAALAAFLHAVGSTFVSATVTGENLTIDVVTASGVRKGVVVKGADGTVDFYSGGLIVATTNAGGLVLNAPAPALLLGAVGSVAAVGSDLVVSAAGVGSVALSGPNGIAHIQTVTDGLAVRGDSATNVVLGLLGSAGASQAKLKGVAGQAIVEAVGGGVLLLGTGSVTILDAQLTSQTFYLSGVAALIMSAAGLNVIGRKIINLLAPTADTDGANKKYVDDKAAAVGAGLVAGCWNNGTGVLSNQMGPRTLTVTGSGGAWEYVISAGANIRSANCVPGGASTGVAGVHGQVGLVEPLQFGAYTYINNAPSAQPHMVQVW